MADRQNRRAPLAVAGRNGSDVKAGSENNQNTSKLIVYLLLIIITLLAVPMIVYAIVARLTTPDLKMTSVTVQNLVHGNSTNPSLNATLKAQIAIDNHRNYGRFRFDSCKAVILYDNSTIGGGDITGGSVRGRKTKVMDVMMRIGTEKLNSSGDYDAGTGLVMLQSYAEMRGKVIRAMKTAKKKNNKLVQLEMNCSMSLSLNNKSIHDLQCR